MANIKRVEKSIFSREGFRVRIHYSDGRDVRSDLGDIKVWPHPKATKGSLSVSEWEQQRFHPEYQGFSAVVLDPQNKVVNGRTRLDNLRASYSQAPQKVKPSIEESLQLFFTTVREPAPAMVASGAPAA